MPERLIYSVYRSFLALIAPVVLFYAVLRVVGNRAYAKTLGQRLGFLPKRFNQDISGAIWIHAVSVGEVMAAETLIRKMGNALTAPVFVSVATLAGYRVAGERLSGLAAGWFYAPVDYVAVVRRVLRTIKPAVVVVLETEIWPNLFREVKRAGCGLLVANGRISDKAFPSYAKRRWFFRAVLRWPDRILAQSEVMRERFVLAGAPAEKVEIAGNLKFDFEPRVPDAESPVVRWLEMGTGPVLIAASTTADADTDLGTDEDEAVLAAFGKLDGWRLILAPRRPERFDRAAKLLEQSGIAFWRRSAGRFDGSERVVLLDTIGELASLFALADVVFMGGTLTETGGHNFLEPAFAGKPVVVGPRLENFREMADDFAAHRALIAIGNAGELSGAVKRALGDAGTGERARELAESKRGGAQTTVDRIHALYSESLVTQRRPLPLRLLLQPLAMLWNFGSRRRSESELRRERRLATPVISVGNITVGGTGKTPFVLHLTRRFREQGLEPAVLTRGYGRISHRDHLVLPRGSRAAVWHTGDEPQILLRSGVMGLGIGPDRFVVGEEAERALKPDVFLADDAFSHRRLARDVDLVLIDSLDPFGGFEAVPLGRLREPMDALARADIFVITRAEAWRPFAAIERHLRRFNPRAPIFRSWLTTQAWVSAQTGFDERPPERVVAFCGLGNPQSFWRSLDRQGLRPLDRLSYGDHHAYAPRELQALANYAATIGAKAMLTTEKDLVNFPEGWEEIFSEIEVLWLRVEVCIENEEALMQLINPAGIRARRASDRQLAPARR